MIDQEHVSDMTVSRPAVPYWRCNCDCHHGIPEMSRPMAEITVEHKNKKTPGSYLKQVAHLCSPCWAAWQEAIGAEFFEYTLGGVA